MTLLPEYRAQLYGAAQRRARRGAVRLPRLWPVAVSTAVAAAVVVVAVAALSHQHAMTPPDRSGTSQPAPSAESVAPLTSILGILNRPQTETDRETWVPGFFNTFSSPGCRAASTPLQCSLRLDPPLVREVDVFGSGYRVGLLPYTSKEKIAGVAVTLRGPGVDYLAAGPWSDSTTIPPGLSELRTRGLMLSAYVSDGVNRGVIVVPNGVARVVLGPMHLLDTTITRRLEPIAGATSVVQENVALFQLNGLTVEKLKLRSGAALRRFYMEGSGQQCRITFAVYRLPAVTHMVWLGSGGRVVNRALVRFDLYVGTHHPAPGSTVRGPNCSSTG
ncbi:MAG: hypothetical protein ACTHMY_10090 [Solirubrobacteraceae bacterium]